MDLEEVGINAGNWVDWAQDMDYCECDIEPLGSISHGVSYAVCQQVRVEENAVEVFHHFKSFKGIFVLQKTN